MDGKPEVILFAIIKTNRYWALSQIFFDSITKPRKPSETLKKALNDYNAFVSESE